MKLIANDTLHVSNVRADPLRVGEEFEINDEEGRALVARGLAREVKVKASGETKKAAKPANKKAAEPKNKSAR
ncbi:MAG TPA: hypothetical protein VMS43_13960 [Allosphingosinicella sp.]|nr:hypothetical protein [Allosphingosinicella sp.]